MPRVHRSQGSRGFSFPEALVVISLIGMALVVVIPAVGERLRSAKVRTSADQFTMTLRAARMISVAERRPVEVRLVPAGSGNYYEYVGSDGENRRITLPLGAEIHPASASSIEFKPNGSIGNSSRTVYIETRVAAGIERWAVHTNIVGVTTVSHQTIE
jgi:type II secretory pathway pseudopilin PulG